MSKLLDSNFLLSDDDSSSSLDSPSPPLTKISCYFNPKTCQRQNFSIPDKIVYYMAKNPKNAKVFKILIQTCKFFFAINPVIVVKWLSFYYNKWFICNDRGKRMFEFNDAKKKYFKIWLEHKFVHEHGNVFPVIPGIYKNDATVIRLLGNYHDIAFEELLLITGNAEMLFMKNHTIKYENGKVVPFEDIVSNLSKLKSLDYYSNGMDFTPDSANKLMEISHFKNMSYLSLYDIPETLDVAKMFDFIVANKHLKVDLYYIRQVSDQFKILLKKYSQMLKKENNCDSTITPYCDFIDVSLLLGSSSEDDEW